MRTNTIQLILVFAVIMLFNACSNSDKGFDKLTAGTYYKTIIRNIKNDKPASGDVLVLSIKYLNEDKEFIEGSDLYRMQLRMSPYKGSFEEGLEMMHVGDSIIFKLDARKFWEITKKRPIPEGIQEGEDMYIHVKLKNFISAEDFENSRSASFFTDYEQEKNLLMDYLDRANITTEPYKGMYVVHKEEGRGETAKEGQTLTVHYTGTFIDGRIFDSSYQRNRPLQFVLGANQVISGWEIGFSTMKPGGKAKFIIPSKLAYRDKGFKSLIPAYATLVFDVELLSVQ